jgi:predicted DNA binding CopG/RHH family protein
MPTLKPKPRLVPNGQTKTKARLYVRMPSDLHRSLKATVALEGLTIEAFVNRLVRDALSRGKETVS